MLGRAWWGFSTVVLASVAGCGLTLDYGPPDPTRDASGIDGALLRDASAGDTGSGDTGSGDASTGDASTGDASTGDASTGDASTGDASTLDAVVIVDATASDASGGTDAAGPSCTSGVDCATGSLCLLQCDGARRCVPNGAPCADVEVCGCDGTIYGSACDARTAGVDVSADVTLCGGCTTLGAPCTIVGTYCAGCPSTIPRCTYRPVCRVGSFCGCDGHTYDNDCAALGAGVATLSLGACPGECVTSADCADSEYCARSACGDVVGTCTPLPALDPPAACGCSGRRYATTHAALRREGIASTCDVCSTRGSAGCCLDSADCSSGELCVGAVACVAGGRCIALPGDGRCYTDEDCAPREVCVAASLCLACGPVCDPFPQVAGHCSGA